MSSRSSTRELPRITQEARIKIILLGDSGVGKTSFVQRYCCDTFSPVYKATIGADFAVKILRYSPTQILKVQIWDIAGSGHFANQTSNYYRGAHGAILLFDLCDTRSLQSVRKWKQDLYKKLPLSVPLVLVGNKSDLVPNISRNSSVEKEISDIVECEPGVITWKIASVKNDINISESVKILIDTIITDYGEKIFVDYLEDSCKTIDLNKCPKLYSSRDVGQRDTIDPDLEDNSDSMGCC
eukprot:TRINITY_DN3367_c0_g1_i2.p1 TRINITY_DN3367_c0_g1~~TRINITY_DN3367_c0_g1_i2.p1  ORF type:complete len:240 (+),score=32.03 TRINITY_DN3367_c0_g1_i2:85-804(+)